MKRLFDLKTQLVDDEVLEVLTLENQYKLFNFNLMNLLSPDDMDFLDELQTPVLEFEDKINGIYGHNNQDFYDDGWFEWAGKHALINRTNKYPHRDDVKIGMKAELLRCWTMDIFDPQFNLAAGASVLAINGIAHHHKNREVLIKDLTKLLDGKKIGCICITEPQRGSDAVNMQTVAEKTDDGFIINGIKCYNTNSPKADIAVVYAVTDTEDAGNTMMQGVVHKDWEKGFKAERIGIPSVPKIQIGKTIFEDSFIPNDYVTGDVGEGRGNLFEGLVPERIGIAALNIGQCWGAFTLAALYSTIRKQFGVKILRHQAVGMSVIGKYYGELTSATAALIKFAEEYDKRIDDMPDNPLMNPYVALASQLKETTSRLYHDLTYESMHAMGGTGVTDQTKMPHYQGVSEIAEVIGGTRNVQLMITSRTVNTMSKMV